MRTVGVPATEENLRGLKFLESLRDARRAFQDANAATRDEWIRSNEYYYGKLKDVLRSIIRPNKRVLELRCLTGDLLAAVHPDYGTGVEIGNRLLEIASRKYPELHFVQNDPESIQLGQKFDYVIFNHIFDTVDILSAFERVREHCEDDGVVIVVNYNSLWQPVLGLASRLGLRSRFVDPNWVSTDDIKGFLKLAGFRTVRQYRSLLFPKWIPLLSWFLNEFIGRLPGVRRLCLMQIIVARPLAKPVLEGDVTVSVIVPCRNEEGNIASVADRLPQMGRHTEIIFCDDKSTDDTVKEIRRAQSLYPGKDIRLVNGPGICKAENVWAGFRAARGDVLMILDADLSVMPEELPMFFQAMISGVGDFVNGSRLVYPMQEQAMKFANMIGNKVFGFIFSFLLDQRIKDTLCGTKAMWRKDWLRMEEGMGKLGIRDLWGDYELLFGSWRLQLEIIEVPVHYQERIHGVTKMTKVFANGLRMLRICWHAYFRLGG